MTSSGAVAVPGLRHGDHRGPQHAVVRAGSPSGTPARRCWRLRAVDHRHRLMAVRIELLRRRVDLGDLRLVERRASCFSVSSTPALSVSSGALSGGERRFERILDRQQLAGEALDRVLVGSGDVGLRLLADVLDVGARRAARRPSAQRPRLRLFSRAAMSGAGSAAAGPPTMSAVGHLGDRRERVRGRTGSSATRFRWVLVG